MKSPYTAVVANVLFPLHELVKRHTTVAVRRGLEASQWWPAERVAAFQSERLRAFLEDVARHVPYYRRLFAEHGIDPHEVRAASDLARLPFLTKSLIRANVDALRADNARGLRRFNTGGSSGEPLVFYIGNERVSHDVAAKWRATRWWDVDIGDPEVVVWGSPIELGAQDRLRQIRDRMLRTELLPAFDMSPAKLDDFLQRIRRRRPRMLFGYPSSLALLARHARKRNMRMDDLGIRVAFVTAEQLYPEQRQSIGEVFNCAVANGYGSRDGGFIAHSCKEGRLHVTAEDIVVEIVDAGGQPVPPGSAGEIAVTHLATRDFPFVRYRTGDVGVVDAQPCPCGRGLPVIKEIQGRTTDFVLAADGTVAHGLAVVYPIRELDCIEAFKVIQETRTRTRVLVVSNAAFGAREEKHIVDGLKARLGQAVEVVVQRVDAIPAERSGKFRYVQSHVAAEAR